MKRKKEQLNEGILDGLLTKFVRILLSPAEARLMAQAAEENADLDKVVKKASKIIDNFKKEIASDPEVQEFLKNYDQKYTIKYH